MKELELSMRVVCSSSGYEECQESKIFYLGRWRKLGDRVHYDNAKGWRKLFKFPIVYIGQGAGQLHLPEWYGWGYGWRNTKGGVKATIIGNTIEPKDKIPESLSRIENRYQA